MCINNPDYIIGLHLEPALYYVKVFFSIGFFCIYSSFCTRKKQSERFREITKGINVRN